MAIRCNMPNSDMTDFLTPCIDPLPEELAVVIQINLDIAKDKLLPGEGQTASSSSWAHIPQCHPLSNNNPRVHIQVICELRREGDLLPWKALIFRMVNGRTREGGRKWYHEDLGCQSGVMEDSGALVARSHREGEERLPAIVGAAAVGFR